MKQTVFDRDAIEVLDYCDDFKEHIKKLNYEWLEKYFRLEKGDVVSLSNPKEESLIKVDMCSLQKLIENLQEQSLY